MNDALVLSNISKRYGSFTAVDGLSFAVPAGQMLGFLGPNGAGKTSTIRMVMGITMPDSGTLTILGVDRISEIKDRVGYLPEERGLYRKLTAANMLRYLGKLKGMKGAALTRQIDDGLERIGLTEWKNKKVEALSKGMQQKLQVLATILHRPDLIILDEPFSGLDPLNVEMLKRMLGDLRSAGTTVIFSTHQMEQAERLCDRILLINRGRKLIEGPLQEIRSRFAERILVLEGSGDFRPLSDLPGVVEAQVTAGRARLEISTATDPDTLLRASLPHVRLTRFEVQSPDLEEIFVRLVRRDGSAIADAATKTAVDLEVARA